MKTNFLTKLKKATSGIILFMLLFSILSPFSNVAYALDPTPSFTIIKTQSSSPEVPETKASITFSINSAPNNSGSLTIWEHSEIYFFDNSGVTDDQPYIGSGSGYIDLTLGEVNTPRDPLQIAEALRGLTSVYANDHFQLDITGSGTGVTFTTSGAESSATEIEFINSTITGAITLVNSITGVLFATGIAQKVDFTVGEAPNQEHIFYKTQIEGHSDVFQTDTATGVALLIKNKLTDYSEVDCSLTDTTVTCTASALGTPFDFTGSLVDLNELYNTINAEYTDGSGRTSLILLESNYTPVTWAAYSGAINSAKDLENTSSVTQEQADQAVADIATTFGNLELYTVPGSISTATGTFISSLSGSVSLTGLDAGGVYSLVYGTGIVSLGVLVATGTTGTLDLQPGFFTTFGNYTLSLSGSKNGSTISDLDSRLFIIGPVNYEDLFDTVGTTLSSAGIANNLSDVTNGDVDNFNGLYFEKTGYGKILFSTGMNLTDSETLDFLQSLPSKLDMSDGHISFDPSNSEFENYGATLFMYFTGSVVPDFNGDSLDYITAKSSTGLLMNDALSGSTLLCAVGVGIPYQVCTFANNHFTSFDFNPYLTDVTISSNNLYSTNKAKNGDSIILDFTGSEAFSALSVVINGTGASSVVEVGSGSNHYIATSVPITGGSGSATFSISFVDANFNNGASVSDTTDHSSVDIDTIVPTLSETTPITSLTDDNTPDLVITASEISTPSFSGSCNAGTGTNTILVGTNTITFNTLTDGAHNDCYITLTDDTGNHSTPLHVSNFTVDATAPVITYEQIKDVKDNNVNLDIGFTDANMGGSPYGIVDFTDVGGISSGTVNLAFSGNVASTNITTSGTGLLSNTLYTYTITLRDSLGNTRTSSGDFTTAKVITLNTIITETGPVSLGFTGDLMDGEIYELSGSLLMYSDPSDEDSMTGSLTLSGVNIIASNGNWDGILIPPTLIDPESAESATGSEVGTGVTIVQTIKVGSETSGLTATGGLFEVSFMVPGYSYGTRFSLYRSQDGNTWEPNSPDEYCILDEDLMCTFETDHLTFFAPGFDTEPVSFIFSDVTNAELSTPYTSNAITVSGIDTGSTVTVSALGLYSISGGSYTSAAGIVHQGDTVSVRQNSLSTYSAPTFITLTIGGVSDNFDVTTKAAPSNGGGGGGAPTLIKDDCTVDYSLSYYDKTCGTKPTGTGTTSTDESDNDSGTDEVLTDNTGSGPIEDTDTLTEEPFTNDLNKCFAQELLPFSDIENSWAKCYIMYLYKTGVIDGKNGIYHPESNTTRAEFIKMILGASKIDYSNANTSTLKFNDVKKDSWQAKVIKVAIDNGLVDSNNKEFRPDEAISRIEAIKILLLSMDYKFENSYVSTFTDINEDWMKKYVEASKNMGLIEGQTINGKLIFRPLDSISRAETSKIIVKFILVNK